VNDQVRIAKIQAHQQEQAQLLQFAGKIVDNPIVELAAWTMFCDYIKGKHSASGITGLIDSLENDAVMAAGVGIIGCQAIAPALPVLAQGVGAVTSVIKGVAAAG
jgi:hypothetical protein